MRVSKVLARYVNPSPATEVVLMRKVRGSTGVLRGGCRQRDAVLCVSDTYPCLASSPTHPAGSPSRWNMAFSPSLPALAQDELSQPAMSLPDSSPRTFHLILQHPAQIRLPL